MTFTPRKAAGQLFLASSVTGYRACRHFGAGGSADGVPTASTYHAFAGSLLREYGLLLPVAQAFPTSGVPTELWQLAFDVVMHSRPVANRQNRRPSPRWSCGCRASLPSILSAPSGCSTVILESSGWCCTCPAGPKLASGAGESMAAGNAGPQTERAALVPLVDGPPGPDAPTGDGLRLADVRRSDGGVHVSRGGRGYLRAIPGGAALTFTPAFPSASRRQSSSVGRRFAGLTAVGIRSSPSTGGVGRRRQPALVCDRFPFADGSSAPTLELSTSWRNCRARCTSPNAVSAEARRGSVSVQPLRSRPDAAPGNGPVWSAARCRKRTPMGRRSHRGPL